METTTEPASPKLRAAFSRYWLMEIYPCVGWDGVGKAPTESLAFLHAKIWRLWKVATTQEGTIE